MPCNGKDGDGCSKDCPSFVRRKPQVDDQSKCKNCGHRRKVHKDRTVQEIIARVQAESRRNKPPTDSEARSESNSGFRSTEGTTRASGSGSGSKGPGKARKKNNPVAQMVKVHNVHIITSGLDIEGDLRDTQSFSGPALEQLKKKKLAAFKTPLTHEDLQFGLDWSQQRIDKWLRETFSLLFEFLDLRYPEDALPGYHWVVLGKHQRSLYVMHRPKINGELLNEAKGPVARNYMEHAVRIATKHKIPTSLFKGGLDKAIERLVDGENLESESEAESVTPSAREKSKAKAKIVLEVDSTSEEEEFVANDDEESDNDRRQTRGFTVVKQEKTDDHDGTFFAPTHLDSHLTHTSLADLFLPDDDDNSGIEEVFPSTVFVDKAGGLLANGKRPPPSRKVLARGSDRDLEALIIVCATSSIGNSTSHGSPSSALLRPATSSFQYDPALDPAIASGSTSGSSTFSYSSWNPTWAPTSIPSPAKTTQPITTSTSTATQPAATATDSPSDPVVAAASSSTYTAAAVASSSILRRPTLNRHVPPPPREGLYVPKPSHNPWASANTFFALDARPVDDFLLSKTMCMRIEDRCCGAAVTATKPSSPSPSPEVLMLPNDGTSSASFKLSAGRLRPHTALAIAQPSLAYFGGPFRALSCSRSGALAHAQHRPRRTRPPQITVDNSGSENSIADHALVMRRPWCLQALLSGLKLSLKDTLSMNVLQARPHSPCLQRNTNPSLVSNVEAPFTPERSSEGASGTQKISDKLSGVRSYPQRRLQNGGEAVWGCERRRGVVRQTTTRPRTVSSAGSRLAPRAAVPPVSAQHSPWMGSLVHLGENITYIHVPERSGCSSSSDSDSDDDPRPPEAAAMGGTPSPYGSYAALRAQYNSPYVPGLAVPLAVPAAAEPPADAHIILCGRTAADAGAAGARQLL
ncbi:hypothetical protein C8R44DRAFT_863019 [Mycena epipterygia]|nr:hypothetical protein C8R44DRAFT_863019 [Mycena epipterygia]